MQESELKHFVESCLDYFTNASGIKASIGLPYVNNEKTEILLEYTGIIGISGERRGGIYVTCGLPFLTDLIPKVIGTTDNSPAMIKDMVGELANTISGNATKAFGKNFNISVPIILEGVPKSLTLPIDTPTYVIPVQWQSHKLFLVVGISSK